MGKLIVKNQIKDFTRSIYAKIFGLKPWSSKAYWEKRYKRRARKIKSGAGSYGRLAVFKAEIINGFLLERNIQSAIEFGSGDGHQLSLIDYENYIGFDVSATAVRWCQEKFSSDKGKNFFPMEEYKGEKADVTLSLDVIYHLIEDEVFNAYMSRLFDAANRFVIIYSSNSGSLNSSKLSRHLFHRSFTDWVRDNRQNWNLIEKIKNKYPRMESDPDNTSFADFYFFEKGA